MTKPGQVKLLEPPTACWPFSGRWSQAGPDPERCYGSRRWNVQWRESRVMHLSSVWSLDGTRVKFVKLWMLRIRIHKDKREEEREMEGTCGYRAVSSGIAGCDASSRDFRVNPELNFRSVLALRLDRNLSTVRGVARRGRRSSRQRTNLTTSVSSFARIILLGDLIISLNCWWRPCEGTVSLPCLAHH